MHFFSRNGQQFERLSGTWTAGDVVQMHLIFHSDEAMLQWRVRHVENHKMHQTTFDVVNLLQFSMKTNYVFRRFAQTCDNILADKAPHDYQEWKSDDLVPSAAKPTAADEVALTDAPSITADDERTIHELRQILQELQDPEWIGLNHDFQAIPHLHEAAQWAMQSTQQTMATSTTFHIYTDGSCKAGTAAWAFIVVCEWKNGPNEGSQYTRIGFSGDVLREDIGPFQCTPADAEATAIIAAAEYLLSRRSKDKLSIFLHFDATGVGYAATGEQNLPRHKDTTAYRRMGARILLQLLQRRCHEFAGLHVKAHQGQPYNEFSDSVATLCRKGWRCPVQPILRAGRLLRHDYKQWAWMEVSPDECTPGLQDLLSNRPPAPYSGTGDELFQKLEADITEHGQPIGFAQCKVGSANVGTMGYSGAHQDAQNGFKVNELLHQFDMAGYAMIGIQESRAKHTQVLTQGPYVRLISAAKKGLGGVELWLQVERLQSIFRCQFDSNRDVTTWSHDERHIAVRLHLGSQIIGIFVGYAPQKGRSDHEIVEWWTQCRQVLQQHPKDIPLFLLGDFNCRIGSVVTHAVSDLDADVEDVGGQFFREICEDWSLIVPSTFHEYHHGTSRTYTGTRGQKTRNDFIAVPCECEQGIEKSYVDETIDLLNGDHDHDAIAVELSMVWKQQEKRRAHKALTYNRQAARNLKHARNSQDIIAPAVQWKVDVDEHWDKIRDSFHSYAKQNFAKPKRQKRQLYMSEHTWQILEDKKDNRQMYKALKQAKSRMLLREVFLAWRDPHADRQPDLGPNWSMLCKQEALLHEQQQQLTQSFRKHKKLDWVQWAKARLDEVVQKTNQARGSELFQILKPKRMIQRSLGKLRKPLPGLRDAQGQWQMSREGIAGAWQRQFAETENADPASMTQLKLLSKPYCNPRPIQVLKQIPTLCDFEQAVRTMADSKATGADGIGAELMQINVVPNSQRLYMLMLKSAMRGQMSSELCGGWLVPLHKGKGSQADMMMHRGIMLESVVARTCSKAWRKFLERGLQAVAAPGQWGGRSGLATQAVHLQVRMWQANAGAKRCAIGLLFVDVRAAFYSVVKPMLATSPNEKPQIRAIFQRLKLPESAYCEFCENVLQAKLIYQATNSEILEQTVAAMLRHAWFLVPDGNTIFTPATGSRPGDPVADLLFGFIANGRMGCR